MTTDRLILVGYVTLEFLEDALGGPSLLTSLFERAFIKRAEGAGYVALTPPVVRFVLPDNFSHLWDERVLKVKVVGTVVKVTAVAPQPQQVFSQGAIHLC